MTLEEQDLYNRDVKFMADYLRNEVATWYAIACGLPDSQSGTKSSMRQHGQMWLQEAESWEKLFVKPLSQG